MFNSHKESVANVTKNLFVLFFKSQDLLDISKYECLEFVYFELKKYFQNYMISNFENKSHMEEDEVFFNVAHIRVKCVNSMFIQK